MPGLDTRTGRRNSPAPSQYIPKVKAAPVRQGNSYNESQSRSVQYSMGPSSTGVSPYTRTNVTPRASDVWGTGNVAGVQSENAMTSFANASNNMMRQNFGYASQAAQVSSGLQRQNEDARSQNLIDQNAASSNQGRITDREKAGRDAFTDAQAYNERQMAASQSAVQARDRMDFDKYQNSQQRQLESNNATKNLGAAAAQADAQIQAAQAAADANKYAASQSARASMFGSLSASLSPQQGWRYW